MSDQTEALNKLRELLPVNSEVYAIVRHVSQSGMSRRISFFVVEDNEIRDLDFLMVRAGIGKRRNHQEGLYIQGCGMDMAFATVYAMASTLHNDGYSLKKVSL